MRARNPSKSLYSRVIILPWTRCFSVELRRNLTPYWPLGRHLGYLPLLRMELLSKAIIDIEIFLQTIACMSFVVSPQVSTYLDRGPQIQPSPSTGKVHALEHYLHPLSWLGMDWICWDRLASPFQVDPRHLMKFYHISPPWSVCLSR